jgi:hypothetical protein
MISSGQPFCGCPDYYYKKFCDARALRRNKYKKTGGCVGVQKKKQYFCTTKSHKPERLIRETDTQTYS